MALRGSGGIMVDHGVLVGVQLMGGRTRLPPCAICVCSNSVTRWEKVTHVCINTLKDRCDNFVPDWHWWTVQKFGHSHPELCPPCLVFHIIL
jgi:hypothetical protein